MHTLRYLTKGHLLKLHYLERATWSSCNLQIHILLAILRRACFAIYGFVSLCCGSLALLERLHCCLLLV